MTTNSATRTGWLLALVAGLGVGVWLLLSNGPGSAGSGKAVEGALSLGDRAVARREAAGGRWLLTFPGANRDLEPLGVDLERFTEQLEATFPVVVSEGAIPTRLEIHDPGTADLLEAMALTRELASATRSDLALTWVRGEYVPPATMRYIRALPDEAPSPLAVRALHNDTSGQYVLLEADTRSVRVLRALVTERASKAIAGMLPARMLDLERVIRFDVETGTALSLADGATLLDALRVPDREIRVTASPQAAND